MPSSRILDLAIGMALVFGSTAALASVFTELIARFLGLRGSYLLTGLRELLDGSEAGKVDVDDANSAFRQLRGLITTPDPSKPVPSVTAAVLGSPMLGSQGTAGTISGRKLTVTKGTVPSRPARVDASSGSGRDRRQLLRSLPSYISARTFSASIVDLVLPDANQQTTMTAIRDNVNQLPEGLPFKTALQALVKTAGDDVEAFRTSVEHWYDDHMARVSGWYKRRTAKITFAVGIVVVVLLNVNAITIGRTLYTDADVRSAVAAIATSSTSCAHGPTPVAGSSAGTSPTGPTSTTPSVSDLTKCLQTAEGELSQAADSGLAIGWGVARDCAGTQKPCNLADRLGLFSPDGGSFLRLVLVLLGFVITIVALVPGARFWFDLLTRLGSLRNSGPKPSAAGTT
jgi:hypothetical protein